MTQREQSDDRVQLEQAIAALEAQRAVLGDVAVDTAVAALHEKLAALEPASSAADQERKQVTILFADVSGFTAMAESMDAEEVGDLMNSLWDRIDSVIVAHGGVIDKHIGDAVMALWGVETTREDDPERATRAALAMQTELGQFRDAHDVQLGMRIGINTGPVVLGGVGTTGEFSAVGDAVNVASRLEQAAPVGSPLISQDTYRHVHGIFEVLPQEPLRVRGKAEPVQSYVVERARPHVFHTATRGVEGIETRMVGRDVELLTLQNTFRDAMEEAETRVVTIAGEAGVGKSRLMYEFENWVEAPQVSAGELPDQITCLKGRATPEMQTIAYSIFRDMFAHRFDIRDSDSAATVLEKFRAGMASILDADRADLVGQFIGFDFRRTASQAVQNLLGSPAFGKLATADLINYLRAVAAEPTVVFLEDVHWADDSSLDLLDHLVRAIPAARLLVVCLARQRLFERRPNWGVGWEAHTQLDLKPLSRRAGRALVGEILQKAEDIPDDLRDMVVEGAEGNPYYVEELIKILIEDGVILRGDERWRVELNRLGDVRVPPTLTGLLQARLDGLPRLEKVLLQRASVVGRLFWTGAVAELEADDADGFARDQVTPLLDAIRGRELVFRRERSAFEGTDEYIFKHAILRDVTYDTVLLKLRRVYHAQVAAWLEANAGERAGEYLSLMAGHYELAGQRAKAVECLRQSGDALYKVSAYREAIRAFERALALTLPDEGANRAALLVGLGDACWRVSDFPAAWRSFEEGLALARESGDLGTEVRALNGLGVVARDQGRYDEAQPYLEEALALAREIGDRAGTADTLERLSFLAYRRGDDKEAQRYAEEALMIFRELGDRQGIADALNKLGSAASMRGETVPARQYFEESLALCREIGDRRGVAARLHNLGEAARHQGEYEEAARNYQECHVLCREIGDRVVTADSLAGLGFAHIGLGEQDTAWGYLRESLRESSAIGAVFSTLWALVGVAALQAKAGRHARAAELLGLVLNHQAANEEDKQEADPVLAMLREALTTGQLETALERGQDLDLDVVVAEILEA